MSDLICAAAGLTTSTHQPIEIRCTEKDKTLDPFSTAIAIGALIVSIATPAITRFYDKRNSQVTALMDLHRRYNSNEMWRVRNNSENFVCVNDEIDWKNSEYRKYDRGSASAESLFSLMRYWHEVFVLVKKKRVIFSDTADLLGSDLAWSVGLVFERMYGRPASRTIPGIEELAEMMKGHFGNQRWAQLVALGAASRNANLARRQQITEWLDRGD